MVTRKGRADDLVVEDILNQWIKYQTLWTCLQEITCFLLYVFVFKMYSVYFILMA